PEFSPRMYVIVFSHEGDERKRDCHRLSSRDGNACTRWGETSQRRAPECRSGTPAVECVRHAVPDDPDIKSAACGCSRRELPIHQCDTGIMVLKRLRPRHCSSLISALIPQSVDIGRVCAQARGCNACHIKAGDRSLAATATTACPIVTGGRAACQDQYHQEKTLQNLLSHLPTPHCDMSPPA